jgi:hypothetical protein
MQAEVETAGVQSPSTEVIYGGAAVAKFLHRREEPVK